MLTCLVLCAFVMKGLSEVDFKQLNESIKQLQQDGRLVQQVLRLLCIKYYHSSSVITSPSGTGHACTPVTCCAAVRQ
jgi:hypothetical protein